MPPRWPRKPDRADPDFRRLDDRMNFAIHVAIFTAINSGAWFFRLLGNEPWVWTLWLTGGWLGLLIAHGIYIFKLVDYGDPGQA